MARKTNDQEEEREDLALLERVQQEDSAAHRLLYRRYYRAVLAFVARRLGDQELAEEVAADVFFEIWRSASRFRGESKVSSWIFGIARFKSMSAVRNASRLKRSQVETQSVEVLHRVPDPLSPTDVMEDRSELERLRGLLEQLPKDQREALEMAVVDGLEYSEIAERQNVTPGTVKTRISRARRGLRRSLGARSAPGG